MAEYITISEFAKKVNLSRQAVYKRLDKDLKGYVIKEGHKLKINVDAIHMIDSNAKVEHTEISECSEVSTVVNLQDLIDKKDKQINDLLEIIKEQNKAIELLITRQCKRSFWRKLISRKNEENSDINSISQKAE
jgi:DNA-binding Lrp family transcriptional regulator